MTYDLANNTYSKVAKDNPKDKISVEIGDSKQADFLPQVKIQRWDNEVNFSARRVHDEKTPTVTTDADKILWQGDKVEANFYELTEGEGGYEFEVILKEKPKTNKVEFTLNTKGLDFFYQPELTQEEIDNGDYQPENVSGSYAVYASENKINYVGGKEYKTGKVGHIYRPRIIDSAGTEVWGELDITGAVLSVTIPQDFLDKAVYPVRHAAGLTFGYTSVGVTAISTSGYCGIVAGTYTATTGDTVTLFTVYADTAGTTGGAIYTIDATPKPTTRLAAVETINVSAAAGWYSSSAVSQGLTNGVKYGVGSGNNATSRVYRDLGAAGDSARRLDGTLPDPFAYDGTTSVKVSIYATYTAAGGGGGGGADPVMSPGLFWGSLK